MGLVTVPRPYLGTATERPIADSGAPIRSEDGSILGVVLVFRDQTEEKALQMALVESGKRYQFPISHIIGSIGWTLRAIS